MFFHGKIYFQIEQRLFLSKQKLSTSCHAGISTTGQIFTEQKVFDKPWKLSKKFCAFSKSQINV